MQQFTMMIVAVLIALCAGCGGSGGGGVTTPSAGGPHALGARGVPGGTVTVTSDGALTPGAATLFHITLGGGLTPTQVAAWIGTEPVDGAVGTAAVPTATGAGTYDVSLLMPATIPVGSHVWVRLVFTDGSVIETGADDFPLVRP